MNEDRMGDDGFGGECSDHEATVIPSIARRLALAHYAERLLEEGVVGNYAALARRLGITRARMTQIMDLTLLPVAEQEAILGFEEASCFNA